MFRSIVVGTDGSSTAGEAVRRAIELAKDLDRHATGASRTLDVLVQVNVSGEASKSGCTVEDAPNLVKAIETKFDVKATGGVGGPSSGSSSSRSCITRQPSRDSRRRFSPCSASSTRCSG